MKQRELPRHLASHGCRKLRERGNHTVYVNLIYPFGAVVFHDVDGVFPP